MRTPSGILHVVDFKTDQIVSAIQPQDYWGDKRHWEIKNNIDMLDFTTFDGTKHAITLQQQNLVLKEVRDGRVVPYVITEAEKDPDKRSITTYASGAWVQIAKSGIINPQRIESKTVNEFIDMALLGIKWKRGNTEYAGFHTMTIDEFIDPLTFLKKIASLFDLEIQYRVEVVGSQITGWYVDMVKKRGQETGKEIEFGKDLVGVKRIEHSREICTALVGFVRGEEEKVITVESINNGLPYITDSDAFQRWNEHGKHKFGFYTPETEEQNMTPQRLMTLMKTEFKKRVNTSVSYEVEAQSIGRVFGLAHELINEGDTIKIKDTGFTPELYLEARVIAGDESFTNPTQDKYVFGDYREIVDPNEELRKIYNRILSSLGNKQEMLDQLDKLVKEANETASNAKKESEAAKTLAEKVQEDIKNNTVEIIESKNPPTTGLKDRKTLWLDISNGKPGILKLWKDGIWDPVVPDVEKVKKETLEQVNKDIESTKTELNQKVQTVENKAKEIAGQIVDVQKQVNGKVDQTWINAQLKDKADKSGVFTKDEINNGFIGKQIYETDKQGNVKKFQEIGTSFEQTNEAIKSKAEKQSVTDLGNNLSQVSKTANEAKQTAEGTQQTITELKSTVENTEIGVRNLLLDTAIKSHSVKTGENKPHTYFDVAKDAATLMQGKNLAMSFLFTGKVTAWGTTNKWAGFEVKITFTDNTFHYPSCRVENRLILGKQYNQERFTATSVVMDKTIKEISVYALARDFTGDTLIEKPKLEIGTVPTAWTPAPEDQVTISDFTKKTVEIDTTIKGINTSVSNVQNEQGKLTERVTKSEQTADGFKTSIESLTKKDTEISNKVNAVELTVEGTKKTITDVQQTTNELKKTTTEITEKAGKISEKLESVEKKFDDIKIGGQNFYKQKSFGAAGGTSITYDDNNKWWNITIPAGASGSWKGILYNTKNATLLVGRTYTISYEIYADDVIPTAMDINNFGVTTVTGTNDNDVVAKRIMRTPKTIAGQWVKVSATFIMPDNITQDFYDNSVFGVGGGWTPTKITNIKIRNMQLEEGNIPTSYRTPSEDQVTTDEFTKKTTDIEKSVDGVKTTVTNVQNSQAGFEKRMTTVEQTASGLSSTVSNLNNVVDSQGKKLTEANTKLEQQATAIGAKVELKQVENYVAGFKIPELKQTVDQNKKDLLGELANKLATEQFNQKMTLIDNRFTINEQGINASAKTTEVYTKEQANGQFATSGYVRDMESRLQLTEKGVSISVKENDVIAAFNMSKENIKLNAARIDLVGKVKAEWLMAGLLSGCQIRTSNTNNYVSLDDQFLRLYESGVPRAFLGYYRRRDGAVQPTFILGSDEKTSAPEGTLFISQMGTGWPQASANIGITDDIVDSEIRKSVFWELNRNGISVLHANDYHALYAGNGNWHFRRGKSGLYQSTLAIEDNSSDADLRLPNITLRNSRVAGYTGVLQVKSSVTQNGWGAVQGNFMSPSLREYKSNIRDVAFSALEKIRNLRIRQFNYKNAVNELYRMREEKDPNDPPLTKEAIKTYYGAIVDESDEAFVDESGKGIHLYSYVSLTIKALQEHEENQNEKIQEMERKHNEEITLMNNKIATLEELVKKLINEKPEQL
ncbi:phage tail protein [Bacillus sp. TH22]|uniref:phage tail spike protein n=1 Tax=Bacillus sp. TH22 TaxID=2796388 RepID=UPI00191183CB|nr:phage tail spike protein [Bacillus sp. TH22]MBK5447499.1 phage tail protein [Bacillus sp. TH22]